MYFLQIQFNNQLLFFNLVISGLSKGTEIIFLNLLPFLKTTTEAYGPISIASKFMYMLLNLFLVDNLVVRRTSTVPKT